MAVIGLGRFGSALAQELYEEGHEVLGMDTDEALVDACKGFLTHAAICNATDIEALRRHNVADMPRAVVAIGTKLENSILATANLAELGVGEIWAKALTEQHRRILERIGADNIVFPEGDAGRRVAHRIGLAVKEYLELEPGFVLAEMAVPARLADKTLMEAGIREDHGVSVVCHKPAGGAFEVTTGHTVLGVDDLIVVAGTEAAVGRFASLAQHGTRRDAT